MADLKISQLTAATTPLAGTEVAPIVQSGTTKKVSVADLTAGRSVAASELTTTGNILAGATSNVANCRVLAENSSGQQLGARYTGIATHYLSVESNGDLNFNRDGTEFARFVNSNTNFALKTGNLVVGTAGKGIDFSANTHAAGMTSELLNWYEEGTFTATLTATTPPNTPPTTTARYTRVGRLVTVHVDFSNKDTTGASGNYSITGLPFTSANNGTSSIGVTNTFSFATEPVGAYVLPNSSIIDLNSTYAGSLTTSAAGAGKYITLTLTYIAA